MAGKTSKPVTSNMVSKPPQPHLLKRAKEEKEVEGGEFVTSGNKSTPTKPHKFLLRGSASANKLKNNNSTVDK